VVFSLLGDRLWTPIRSLALVQKYVGPDDKITDMSAFFDALVEALSDAHNEGEDEGQDEASTGLESPEPASTAR